MKLNDKQKQAVDHDNGPALVVAGAGTGKTSVIVERVVRLIESGVDRKAILALTFTEKATQEMVDRVADRLKESYAVELNIFTFNAFGQELLREFATDIGLSADLRLVGDTGKVVLLREHLDALGLDYYAPISSPESQLANLADYFSKLKQQCIKPKTYVQYADKLPADDEATRLEKERHSELARAFETYLSITRETNAIDYDDQIYLVLELLESRPNILKKLQDRYEYILVDEFQDTNPMQSRLIELLSGDKNNVMAVGDDDQSIYGWRGATLANILSFSEVYPKAEQITLVDNYRSSQPILDAAHRLIQHNNPHRLEAMNGLDKQLVSHSSSEKAPHVRSFSQRSAEEAWIAQDIARRIKNGQDPATIAVLSRRTQTAQRMSETLSYHDVDHVLVGIKTDIYRQPIIGSMISALEAIADPHNAGALYHTLTGPLFKVDAAKLTDISASSRRAHESFAENLKTQELCLDELTKIEEWRNTLHETTVSTLAYTMLDETGLKTELYEAAQNDEATAIAVRTLGQWFESLREFQAVTTTPSAVTYLENLATLQAEGESLDESEFDTSLPVVMSVHKSKGLEWETVYIVDCTEYSFPLRASRSNLEVPEELRQTSQADEHIAEERRLMYVAATRAKSELICSYSESHSANSKRKPSRFLSEMFGEDILTSEQDVATSQTSLELFNTVSSPATVGLPSSMRVGKDLILSASQANDYMRCPLDFYFRHVLGVPAEPSAAAAIGTSFHSLIHKIHTARIEGSSVPSLDEIRSEMSDSWPVEGFVSAQQRERAKKTALSSLSDMYERLLSEDPPKVSEHPFRIRVPESNLILRGRIDAVVSVEKGVRIVDYKTSASASTAEKAKRSTSSSKQLEMYALAWREETGEAPAEVSLDFVQTNQVGIVKKKSTTLDTLAGKLKTIGEDIQNGKFPEGRSHDYCRHP